MTTHELIDNAIREVAASFTADAAILRKLKLVLAKFPNCTPQEIWNALPILFWHEKIDADSLRSIPYKEFLKTPYWMAVSDHVKTMHPWCVLCTEPFAEPLEVHHRTYIHRGSEWLYLDDLTVLCHECHQWVSKKPSRWKNLPLKRLK